MITHRDWLILCACIAPLAPASAASPVDELLLEYRQQGAAAFSSDSGRDFWNQTFSSGREPRQRRCASCHGSEPRQGGRHIRTRKPIGPLAPSINPNRLATTKEIRKWLKRNCKWTLGRECSAQEKGNVLTYLKDL